MKIIVVHDKRGNISSIGIPGKGSKGVSLVAPKGKSVTEVDAPEIKNLKADGEEQFEQVLDLIKGFRIDVSSKKPKLVRK